MFWANSEGDGALRTLCPPFCVTPDLIGDYPHRAGKRCPATAGPGKPSAARHGPRLSPGNIMLLVAKGHGPTRSEGEGRSPGRARDDETSPSRPPAEGRQSPLTAPSWDIPAGIVDDHSILVSICSTPAAVGGRGGRMRNAGKAAFHWRGLFAVFATVRSRARRHSFRPRCDAAPCHSRCRFRRPCRAPSLPHRAAWSRR